MDVVCFDASALVKLVVDEDGSELAAALWDEAGAAVAHRLAFVEVEAALSAARRAGRLRPTEARRAHDDWRDYWSAVRIVELTPALASAAADLARELVLGGADAVHLATALLYADADAVFAVWDERLRTAALGAGITVAPAAR